MGANEALELVFKLLGHADDFYRAAHEILDIVRDSGDSDIPMDKVHEIIQGLPYLPEK